MGVFRGPPLLVPRRLRPPVHGGLETSTAFPLPFFDLSPLSLPFLDLSLPCHCVPLTEQVEVCGLVGQLGRASYIGPCLVVTSVLEPAEGNTTWAKQQPGAAPPSPCVFRCLRGQGTAFALCVPLPSLRLIQCLCLAAFRASDTVLPRCIRRPDPVFASPAGQAAWPSTALAVVQPCTSFTRGAPSVLCCVVSSAAAGS